MNDGILSGLSNEKKDEVRQKLLSSTEGQAARVIAFMKAMVDLNPQLETDAKSADGPGLAELTGTMLNEMAGMALSVADGSGHEKHLPSDEEWDLLKVILPVLRVMSRFQVQWQGQKYVTVSALCYQWKTMVRKLQRIGEKSDSGAAGELARFFVDRLNKRESLFLRPSTIIAAFLHPAHRTELTPGNIQMAVHCAVHTTHSTHTHVCITHSIYIYMYVYVACISTHSSTPTILCVSRERDRCVEK